MSTITKLRKDEELKLSEDMEVWISSGHLTYLIPETLEAGTTVIGTGSTLMDSEVIVTDSNNCVITKWEHPGRNNSHNQTSL